MDRKVDRPILILCKKMEDRRIKNEEENVAPTSKGKSNECSTSKEKNTGNEDQ